jgi:hypothetical protein
MFRIMGFRSRSEPEVQPQVLRLAALAQDDISFYANI